MYTKVSRALFRIFIKISEFEENVFCRELYYRDIKITQRQENVNEAIKIICCLLDVTPWELGVMSTSKGILAGSVQIRMPNDNVIDCGLHTEGKRIQIE